MKVVSGTDPVLQSSSLRVKSFNRAQNENSGHSIEIFTLCRKMLQKRGELNSEVENWNKEASEKGLKKAEVEV